MTGKPELTLEIDVNLLTLNEYIDVERSNRYKAASLKKSLTTKVKLQTMSQTRTQLKGQYDLVLDWYRINKRHDPDNVFFGIKFILDGIAAAKVIPNDDRNNIRNIHHNIHQGNKNAVIINFYSTKK